MFLSKLKVAIGALALVAASLIAIGRETAQKPAEAASSGDVSEPANTAPAISPTPLKPRSR